MIRHLTKAEFDTYKKEVLSIKSFGPFLVKFSDDSDIQILVPKPANALYHEDKQTGEKTLVRLAPKQNFTITDKDGNIITKQIDKDCGSDLLDGLLHVQTQQALKGKPAHARWLAKRAFGIFGTNSTNIKPRFGHFWW